VTRRGTINRGRHVRLGRLQVGTGEPEGADRAVAAQGTTDLALLGSWSATRWQYTARAADGKSADVVADLGGTVTLSLSLGTYVLTWDIAGRKSASVGGALHVIGDRLELFPPGGGGNGPDPESLIYRFSGATLALSSRDSGWDFNGDGREEPADFVAVLVRL
jgi:hypothetical protein